MRQPFEPSTLRPPNPSREPVVSRARVLLTALGMAALLVGARTALAGPDAHRATVATVATSAQAGDRSAARPPAKGLAGEHDDLAAIVAGARTIQPVADHAAMSAAIGPYAARALAKAEAQAEAEAEAGTKATRPSDGVADTARVDGMRGAIAGVADDDWAAGGKGGARSLGKHSAPIATGGDHGQPDLVGADAAREAQDDPTNVDGWRSFDLDGAGYLRSDGALAVGPDAVLGAVNGALRPWDKDGNPLLDQQDLTSWFEPLVGQLIDDFDLEVHVVSPRATYSDAYDRFVITAVALPVEEGVDVPLLFVGMSNTADPAGSFCVARISPVYSGDPAGLGILDYSMSVNDHALSVAFNLYQRGTDGSSANYAARAYVEALAPLAACEARDSGLFEVYYPADFDTFNHLFAADTLGVGDDAVYVGSHDAAGALLQPLVMRWLAGGARTDLAALTPIVVPNYTYPPDASQPGTSDDIATGYANVRSAVYIGPDDLWTAQAVTVGSGAGAVWQRLSLEGGVLDGGRVGLQEGNDLYHPQIMPALECDAAMIAFNYSGPEDPVSAAVMQLGEDHIVPIAQGDGCVAQGGDPTMPWDQRVPIAYDPYDELYWLQPSVADGTDADCTANQWATHIVHVEWDLCGTTGPEPTPPPTGERKGIGFALGSKRTMRDIHGAGGMVARGGAMRGAALTGIQVQNIDGVRTAQPAIEFAEQRSPYAAPGGLFVRTIEMDTIPPGASLNAYLPNFDILDAMYRITISTPRDGGDLSAILRTDWDTGGAAIVSNLWNATRVVLPRVVRNANTHTSVIAVTNAGSDIASVTMRFYRSGASDAVATKRFDMQPAEALTFDLNDADPVFAALGNGFAGTAILESVCCQVGVQVYEYAESSALAIGGYEGIPAEQASSQLFVPLFRHQQHGPGGIRLDTAIVVANASDQATGVTVTYHPTTNASASAACRAAGTVRHGPITIPANTNHAFYQGPGGGHGLPDDCFGSAVVDAADPRAELVATVLDAQNGNEQLSMINAAPVEFAATKLALPLFRSRHLVAEYTTGIQVMNTSDRPATVHIDFSRSEGNVTFPITGCRGQCDAVIQPYEGYTWWPPAVEVIPPDTYGAAVIESDQPIVVLVNDYPLRGNSDMATYAGIAVLLE